MVVADLSGRLLRGRFGLAQPAERRHHLHGLQPGHGGAVGPSAGAGPRGHRGRNQGRGQF